MREFWFANFAVADGRVVDEITAGAIRCIGPNVMQVQEMSYFVGRRAAQIEWCGGAANRAECCVEDDNTIGCRRTAGKLSITEQSVA